MCHSHQGWLKAFSHPHNWVFQESQNHQTCWPRKVTVNMKKTPREIVLQLLLPLAMGNVGGPIWDIEVVSFFVPSQYLLVHMSFAVFGNSLFCLDLKLASLLRCLLKTEFVKKCISQNLSFSFSVKEAFDTDRCLKRDEMQVVKNIYGWRYCDL